MTEREENPASPRRRHGIRRGIYLVPSAFTIGNILCGFYAVVNSIKGYQSLSDPQSAAHFFDNAALAICWAWLLDGLDGRIARMTGATSDFGVELDSVADVVSFGVAPAVLAYTWGYGSTPGLEHLAWGVSFFFLICGALRLARFNVQARAPRFAVPGASPKLDKRYFVGLPIPAGAGLIAAIVHGRQIPIAATYFQGESAGDLSEARIYTWALLVIVAALAVLMVSTIRYTSFKSVGPRSNRPFIILPLLSLVVAGIWFYSRWVLLLIAASYVLHGPLLKLWNLLNRQRRPLRGTEDQPPSPV
jgi:CDP-diacylglycerol--serine O-phosphatidyltransferase